MPAVLHRTYASTGGYTGADALICPYTWDVLRKSYRGQSEILKSLRVSLSIVMTMVCGYTVLCNVFAVNRHTAKRYAAPWPK